MNINSYYKLEIIKIKFCQMQSAKRLLEIW